MGAEGLTSLGADLEAVVAAVIGFLAGGVVMFFCCFLVTKLYLIYKRRQIRKKRRDEGRDDSIDFTDAMMQGDLQFDVDHH